MDVSFDAYPYTAGSTVVQMCLPEWAQAGGPEKLLERLRDGETRARVIADLRQSKSIEWDKSVIAGDIKGAMASGEKGLFEMVLAAQSGTATEEFA